MITRVILGIISEFLCPKHECHSIRSKSVIKNTVRESYLRQTLLDNNLLRLRFGFWKLRFT